MQRLVLQETKSTLGIEFKYLFCPVYDLVGVLILKDFLASNSQLNISNFLSGMYLLELSNSSEGMVNKFMKN